MFWRCVYLFVLQRSDAHRCLPLSRSERRASARVTAVASSTDIATDASLPQGDGTRDFAEDAESEHLLSFVVSEAASAQESTSSVSVVSRLLASFYDYTLRTSVPGTLLPVCTKITELCLFIFSLTLLFHLSRVRRLSLLS